MRHFHDYKKYINDMFNIAYNDLEFRKHYDFRPLIRIII